MKELDEKLTSLVGENTIIARNVEDKVVQFTKKVKNLQEYL